MTENEISKIIFDCGLKVHRKLGVGLYENVYEQCLEYELKKAGLKVERQKEINVVYEELIIEKAFDILLTVGAGNIDTLYDPIMNWLGSN